MLSTERAAFAPEAATAPHRLLAGGAEITELIHILDGTATLEIVCDDGPPRSFVLRAGTIAVNPQGAWHRLHPSEGVTSMTATPSPREVIELDVDDPRTVECKPA